MIDGQIHQCRPENAPIGSIAPSINGGHWFCMGQGIWMWNGPYGSGSKFPRPGGDWDGRIITDSTYFPPRAKQYMALLLEDLADRMLKNRPNNRMDMDEDRCDRMDMLWREMDDISRKIANARMAEVPEWLRGC